jgi:hypothetical protein
MSTPAPTPSTVTAAKDAVFNDVNRIVTSLLPNVATDVKARLEEQFKKMFSSFLEGLKKSGKDTASDVLSAGADAVSKLKKELQEAADEMASKQKTAIQATTDALADWATVMAADPKVVAALKLLPDVANQFQAVIDAGRAIKTQKGEITIKYTTFVGSLLGLAVTVMTLIVLVMEVFGK